MRGLELIMWSEVQWEALKKNNNNKKREGTYKYIDIAESVKILQTGDHLIFQNCADNSANTSALYHCNLAAHSPTSLTL